MKFWVSRDLDGTLVLSDKLPYLPNKSYNYFCFGIGVSLYYLNKKMFPEVTFENSPKEVEIKFKNTSSISESIVNEFMNILNFTYDKSEKCMVAKIQHADLSSLKNIIESKLC